MILSNEMFFAVVVKMSWFWHPLFSIVKHIEYAIIATNVNIM